MIDFSFVSKHLATRTHEKMKEVLMDPTASGPAIYYYMIRGGSEQKNITVLEPGTVGTEYIKTYGHYHIGKLDETYTFLSGKGFALLQKLAVNERGEMIPDKIIEFKIIPAIAGDHLFIPAGYGHLIINIGNEYFTTLDDSPVNFEEKDASSLPGHADYSLVRKMHGFGYYVVEHDGNPALMKNKNYTQIDNEELADLPVIG